MMKRRFLFLSVAILAIASSPLYAQIDEVSEITGLPIPIGASVIYGQVNIRNIPRGERRPTVYVYLRNGGAQLDKYKANDKGYWYFLRQPIDGHALTFEVDGMEVGRAIIAGGISNRFRQDVEFDYSQFRGAAQSSPPSVVSTRDRHERDPESEKAFEKALASLQNAKYQDALALFNEIVQKDEKDHNAWMYIGSIHYAEKRNNEARKAYERALSLKPDYFLANLNLGKLELSEKKYDAAVAALSKAVAADGSSADANHLLGEAHLQNKKGSLAVGFLNKAIELDPTGKADIHLRLAALYNGAGLKDRAALEYKAFLEKVKDHPDRKKFEQYVKENLPKT
ncbi:MAG: tetratricopeptide repeat protein [Chloracidobacterium sp.]|nr:tetratricopeptide repeat protein [Chloracidobacterium sp.]